MGYRIKPAIVVGVFIVVFIVLVVRALDGLPVVGDAVEGIEAAAVGLTREDHAFELGVGKHAVRCDAFRQHRAVIRRGM